VGHVLTAAVCLSVVLFAGLANAKTVDIREEGDAVKVGLLALLSVLHFSFRCQQQKGDALCLCWYMLCAGWILGTHDKLGRAVRARCQHMMSG
jgi:hypothetical protein